MNKLKQILGDGDVKKSVAYLAISLGISGAKALVKAIRERRANG